MQRCVSRRRQLDRVHHHDREQLGRQSVGGTGHDLPVRGLPDHGAGRTWDLHSPGRCEYGCVDPGRDRWPVQRFRLRRHHTGRWIHLHRVLVHDDRGVTDARGPVQRFRVRRRYGGSMLRHDHERGHRGSAAPGRRATSGDADANRNRNPDAGRNPDTGTNPRTYSSTDTSGDCCPHAVTDGGTGRGSGTEAGRHRKRRPAGRQRNRNGRSSTAAGSRRLRLRPYRTTNDPDPTRSLNRNAERSAPPSFGKWSTPSITV